MKALFTYIFFCFSLIGLQAQFISTATNYTAEQLVNDIFLGSSCIEVVEGSVSIKGSLNSNYKSWGYFNRNNSRFPISEGIILSSGRISEAQGPKGEIQSYDEGNWRGDRDLEEALEINNTVNATVLEFEFISRQDEAISFQYLFASEQYLSNPRVDQCNYTDGFAFLIKDVDSQDDYLNLAIIPDTNTPVAVNTVRPPGTRCPTMNPQFFDQYNVGNSPINFNGQTKVLNAVANVQRNKRYRLKLVIADQGNGYYDSAVFLKARSFSTVKDLGTDKLVSDRTALCFGETYNLDATMPGATNYQWYKDGEAIINATNANYTVTSSGDYEVDITLASGCVIKGSIRIEYYNQASINLTNFELCDTDFDGIIPITLSQYNNQIVEGTTSQIKYYATQQNAENNINEIQQITLSPTQNTITVFAAIKIADCPTVVIPITFKINTTSQANPISIIEICDELLDNSERIDLDDYIHLIGNNINDDYKIFLTQSDAIANRNSVSEQQVITDQTTFYIRFSHGNFCPAITSMTFKLKAGKTSDTLIDQTICEGATTNLDAGDGFESYLWLHNNSTSRYLNNVGVGTYKVRLEFNGCFYTQEVTIHATENPIIENIVVSGTTVTVIVRNPNSNYLYALDNGIFQSSNVFYNVPIGNHTIAVKSSTECNPVLQDFSIVNMVNFFSPNQDGINDKLDYSVLNYKNNPKFQIYNRFGKLLFDGNSKNNFIWDGKFNGKIVPSGSYWYNLEWSEPGSDEVIKKVSWILIKSSN